MNDMDLYLGIDVGSVTIKLVLIDSDGHLTELIYLRTHGKPIQALQKGLKYLHSKLPRNATIRGVGTTGSARHLAAAIVGGDVVKNEITSQVVATVRHVPDVQTIMEIGGQDSKIIVLRNSRLADFGMNTICAAGTGSFLDHQASRLNMDIGVFGDYALRSRNPARITGKCTVFAESDMVQKQQMGHQIEDIIYGLCQALTRNYLSNVGLGKEIRTPVVFQGGVAFNQGMVRALREALETDEVIVPPHPEAMGAIGAAFLAAEEIVAKRMPTAFKGFGVAEAKYSTSFFECQICPNFCEVARISLGDRLVACCGGRCDVWEQASVAQTSA